jgi:hypothetical protein
MVVRGQTGQKVRQDACQSIKAGHSWVQWLTSAILVTQEAEIRRVMV